MSDKDVCIFFWITFTFWPQWTYHKFNYTIDTKVAVQARQAAGCTSSLDSADNHCFGMKWWSVLLCNSLYTTELYLKHCVKFIFDLTEFTSERINVDINIITWQRSNQGSSNRHDFEVGLTDIAVGSSIPNLINIFKASFAFLIAVPLIEPDLSTTQMISLRYEHSIGSILNSVGFKSKSNIAFLLPSFNSQMSKLLNSKSGSR